MERLIKLSHQDIAQILADHFNVDRKDVNLTVERSRDDCGIGEHRVFEATATIKEK